MRFHGMKRHHDARALRDFLFGGSDGVDPRRDAREGNAEERCDRRGFGQREFGGRGPGGRGFGGHGFGGRGFGGGRGGRGFDGGEGFGSRKFSSAQLQLLLLALLEQRPAHGYELIRDLEARSGGFYAPSPGMVYPALTFLDETGLASATTEGNRKLYTITEAGLAHLQARREEAELILGLLDRIGGRMEAVREAFSGVSDVDPEAADELHRARRGLKAALIRARGAGPDEARRIARILDDAARQILAASKAGEGKTGEGTR